MTNFFVDPAGNAVAGGGALVPVTQAATKGSKLSNFFNSAKLKWGNMKPGLASSATKMSKAAPWMVGVSEGIDAISGLSEQSSANKDASALRSQIVASAASNPLLSSYLTSDQLKEVNRLRRGDDAGAADASDAFNDPMNLLAGAGKGALSGLAAGALPAIAATLLSGGTLALPALGTWLAPTIIGGIGGAINAGIDNVNTAQANDISKLDALYASLADAEMQYKAMKRPNFTGLGIQQRYQNMYA